MYITFTIEHSPPQRCWWRYGLDSSNYVLCLWRDNRVGSLFWAAGCGFPLGGPGEGAAEEIFGAMLCASCPNHKQSKHTFFTAPLACSESTDNHHCLTSRRIHHCWASCLEMLMLLCGFFRTHGQHLPHQTYLSFAALSQPVLYSRCNLFSMNDKPGGPQR